MAVGIEPKEIGDPALVPPPESNAAPDLPEEGDVLREFNGRFRASKDHHQEWRDEARRLYDLVAGRQWDREDEARMREQSRPFVSFNLTAKYADAIVGLQVNNRQAIRYYPREPGDVRVNEMLTAAVTWGRDLTDVASDETDAFGDCVLVGYGWMQGYLDRDQISDGVPTGMRVDPLEMFPDPAARKRNLSDARFLIRVKFVDKAEYEELTGKDVTDDDQLAELAAEEDDILKHVEEPQDYRENSSQADSSRKGRLPVAEYEFWRRETQFAVQAKDFGGVTMEAHEWKVYEPLLKRAKAQYTVTPVKKKVYYRARIASGAIVELKRSPYQDGFTFHGITGKRDRNRGVFYGIGRALLDPQKWVNTFFSSILYSLMTGAKGGLMAEENSFTDARKAESEWSNPASITWLKEGALQKGKVMPKPAPAYPEGMDRLMNFSMNSIPQISGLNAELLGLAERVQAGVVEAQRKQSAMAMIAWCFDAMRLYYKTMGRQMAAYVRDYMSEGTLILVTGEAGKQYVPLTKSRLAQSYDVIVDEAPTSVNMQERTWAVLETLIPQMLSAGMKLPNEILDYAPLPADLQEQWKKALQPDPQSMQIQQASVKATLDKLVAEVSKLQAGAQLDQAKAQEIMAELGKPIDNSQQAQMELLKAQVEAQVQSRIAEFKVNREAETKLLIAEMGIKSDERIAMMEAAITARLDQAKVESDSKTKLTVASIARGKAVQELEQEAEEKRKEAEDASREAERKVQEAQDETAKLADELKAIKEIPPPKPKKFKVRRNKRGDMDEVHEESSGRKFKVKRDADGNMVGIEECG